MRLKTRFKAFVFICSIMIVCISSLCFSENRKTISDAERSAAVAEIQNLMGRYAFYYPAHMNDEIMELFAQHTPDTRLEMVWGVYDGIEGVKRCYYEDHKNPGAGHMIIHTMTSQVIEVAGDGKTAKGAWISPGLSTNVGSAEWSWCKYGVDFIKEDGKWKIWHFHVYGIFMTDYNTPWTESTSGNQGGGAEGPPPGEGGPPLGKGQPGGEGPPSAGGGDAGARMMMSPDRPVTVEPWDYCTTCVYPEDQPRPPEPYYTFSETFSY